jgi:cytochrome c peroxidase
MKRLIIIFFLGLLTSFGIYNEYFNYPTYFPIPTYNFKENPLKKDKILLGKLLFYDPIFSKNNQVSCASCHSSYNAFAHTDHNLSHGIGDQIGNRNAPALFNLAWQKNLMWDGAIHHLDVQSLAPISNPKEMGENIKSVVEKLQKTDLYPDLFKKAFGDKTITGERILKAIAQFELTLISANSKYDQVKLGKEKFSEQEQKGYDLFKKNCNSCHTEPLFFNNQFENNGLPLDSVLQDFGKFSITKNAADKRKFKVPSLRNLSYTYPYMHDGRFKKLQQVLNHYTSGIEKSETLSPLLQNNIALSADEKVDLIAFLLTLNDKEFVFDEKFQFPEKLFPKNEGKAK